MGRRLNAVHSDNQTFGEKFLEFFAKYAPNEIAYVALNSTTFRDLMSAKLCEMLLRIKSEDQL